MASAKAFHLVAGRFHFSMSLLIELLTEGMNVCLFSFPFLDIILTVVVVVVYSHTTQNMLVNAGKWFRKGKRLFCPGKMSSKEDQSFASVPLLAPYLFLVL